MLSAPAILGQSPEMDEKFVSSINSTSEKFVWSHLFDTIIINRHGDQHIGLIGGLIDWFDWIQTKIGLINPSLVYEDRKLKKLRTHFYDLLKYQVFV